jgi:hypothetical protein
MYLFISATQRAERVENLPNGVLEESSPDSIYSSARQTRAILKAHHSWIHPSQSNLAPPGHR